MDKFDKLNEELKSVGFQIDGDNYILDKVTYQTTILNGRKFQQPQHTILKMEYIGEGCEVDDSDNDIEETSFFEFGILDDDKIITIICIRNLKDLREYINV